MMTPRKILRKWLGIEALEQRLNIPKVDNQVFLTPTPTTEGSGAVEATEDSYYETEPNGNVVTAEPEIVSVMKARADAEVRRVQQT